MSDPIGGWRATAPEVFELVDRIEIRAAAAIDPVLVRSVRAAVASILGPGAIAGRPPVPAAGPAPSSGLPLESVVAVVELAEQFVVDVASTSDAQRAALNAAMGHDAFTVVQVLYVTDVFGRMRIGLDRLGPPVPAVDTTVITPAAGGLDDDLWSLLERFMQQVARRDALDPLTAELVRLRGARVHDCRLCRSRLSVRALDQAGDPSVFELDDLDHPDLDLRQREALRLADALVTQPSSIDAALADAVRDALSTDEIVEVVLDVARNAANKIAVALGADAPVVADGTEYYDLDASGEVVADVDMDVVRAATH